MVADFLARRSGALEGAYRAFGTALYSTARNVMGNDDDAQDCVHDALLRVWQQATSYRSERGGLRTFLLARVRNEALSRKRNAARHFRIEQQAAASERRDYEIEVTDYVERDRLRRAVATLPTEQRVAWSWHIPSTCRRPRSPNGSPSRSARSRAAWPWPCISCTPPWWRARESLHDIPEGSADIDRAR